MSSADLAAVTKARLATAFGSARAVYAGAVPAGALPDRYVLVTASVGESSSTNASGKVDQRAPVVIVTSVSRNADGQRATEEVAWASRKAVDALTDTRPTVGQAAWFYSHEVSSRPMADDSLPEPVMFATDQFVARYQP